MYAWILVTCTTSNLEHILCFYVYAIDTDMLSLNSSTIFCFFPELSICMNLEKDFRNYGNRYFHHTGEQVL